MPLRLAVQRASMRLVRRQLAHVRALRNLDPLVDSRVYPPTAAPGLRCLLQAKCDQLSCQFRANHANPLPALVTRWQKHGESR